ncbi:MAG: AIPR family protein [Synechococcus sp.]
MTSEAWLSALKGRSDLTRYGNNAVLLFALEIHQDIDDIQLVANDALTDGRSDKKCDLVYVNAERGKIIIAQGYWSQRDRPSAQANKASDLNTAVTWLLSGDLGDMPENLSNAAEQVRESINSNYISSIDLWYVHNLPESKDVSRELERVEVTCNSIIKSHFSNARIDNICGREVGNETLGNWYRGTKAPILVNEKLEIETAGGYTSQGGDWSAYSTSVEVSWLKSLFEKHGRDLFSANVRDYLGSRSSTKNINDNIKRTAKEHPDMFWVYNNGITVLVHDFRIVSQENSNTLEIDGVAVVNGAQTTGALGTISIADIKDAKVAARFVKCSDPATIKNIIRFNNSQNKVEAADFRSNDAVQTRLRGEFEGLSNVYYSGGRRGGEDDAIRRTRNVLSSHTVGQALTAFHGDPGTAYNQKSEIWGSDRLYNHVFNEKTTAKHVLFVYSLLQAIQERQEEFRNRVEKRDNLTDADQRQYDFLRLRGSSFLLISVMAASLQEVCGAQIPDKFKLAFSSNTNIDDAANHWKKLITVMLPLSGELKTVLARGNLKNKQMVENVSEKFGDLLKSQAYLHAEKFAEFNRQLD